MTGIVRETSGLTVPVTLRVEADAYSVAVTTGKRFGWSTVMRLTPPSFSTCTGGGACAAGSCFSPPQPLNMHRLSAVAMTTMYFMNRPHQPMQDSNLFPGKAPAERNPSRCLKNRHGARFPARENRKDSFRFALHSRNNFS